MAISEKQLEANRRNALKSTGPRTRRGKDRSRENAVKHGLSSDTLVFKAIRHEDPERFLGMRNDTIESWRPVGAKELQICEMIANAFVRIQRAENFESSFFTGAIQFAERSHRDPNAKKNDDLGCGIVLGKAEHELSWENIDRCRRHAWLDYNRAVTLLEKMQKQRIELAQLQQEEDDEVEQQPEPAPAPGAESVEPAEAKEAKPEMGSFRNALPESRVRCENTAIEPAKPIDVFADDLPKAA